MYFKQNWKILHFTTAKLEILHYTYSNPRESVETGLMVQGIRVTTDEDLNERKNPSVMKGQLV